MIDPNTSDAIEARKAQLEADKQIALTEIAAILKAAENQVSNPEADADCSPRFEAVMYPVYLGIWLYQTDAGTFWSVEVDRSKVEWSWLEDGIERAETVGEYAYFGTFAEAKAVLDAIVTRLSNLSYFDNI
ncbi:hypothetical protein IB265_33055 [Ensifer sp. ENS10]|uniref:hypothetical protein n=1 Tax=Ensifer sp. ENS10 TaxID=2769286 RepID=UPI0017853E3B|nr:hypothetical protein [Ensifer sp. ENS10]MBD9511587.1 hypothetical protein [Ensifer sp. ENS10]